MRLVLDTNVVVSALLWGGMPYRLLQQTVEGEAELFTSPTLVAELGDVLLRRSHLAVKLTEKGLTVASLTTLYLNLRRSSSLLLYRVLYPMTRMMTTYSPAHWQPRRTPLFQVTGTCLICTLIRTYAL